MNRQPLIEIETTRLVIRPSDARSGAELQRLLADARVAEPYYGGSRPARQLVGALPWVQGEHDWTQRSLLTLAVRERAAGVLLGAVRLDQGRLSYLVHPRHWRQGYGAEMVQACCRRAHRDLALDELQASVMRDNLGSRRILERAGFEFAGLKPRQGQDRPPVVAVLRYRLRTRAAAASNAPLPGTPPG